MKKLLLLSIAGVVVAVVGAKNYDASSTNKAESDTPRMKQYWLVMLLKGTNRTHDKETSARIQAAHMANIGRLANEGKIVMAGPMGYKHDADLRGIFIIDAKDSATAASYVNTDSAIITGRLRFELHPWWTQTGTYIFK
jgi:uncharacterized protein YciI